MENKKKLEILYLCTGNSCRSQMAEGFNWYFKNDWVNAYSAGVNPKGIDPMAIKAMAEVGIDISRQQSKSISDVKNVEFDFVITLCENAQKTCPTFPGKASVVHMTFEDPPRLAADSQNDEEAMIHYRSVRDQIKVFVEELPEILNQKKEDVVFDQGRFVTGLKSVLEQMPEHLKSTKK